MPDLHITELQETMFQPYFGTSFLDTDATRMEAPLDVAWLSTLPFDMEF